MQTKNKILLKIAAFFVYLIQSHIALSDLAKTETKVVGNGVVLAVGSHEFGSITRLQAVPQVDWRFHHWEGVSGINSSNSNLSLTDYNNFNPVAVFVFSKGSGRFEGGKVFAWGAGGLDGLVEIPVGLDDVTKISTIKSG